MILPSSPNRLWLLSFWLVICLLTGIAAGILLWVFASPGWSGLGLTLAAIFGVAGLLRPKMVTMPYEIWNGLANRFVRFARVWVAGTCFYIIFVAVGKVGAALNLERSDDTKSFWVSRDTAAPGAYVYEHKTTAKGSTQHGWMYTFVSWAVGSSNSWTCCLLPFLVLMRALEAEEKSSFPSNIYTLY